MFAHFLRDLIIEVVAGDSAGGSAVHISSQMLPLAVR
jgi:hypothetical protein